MQKIQILAFGLHEEILETVLRLINKNQGWQAVGTSDEEEAVAIFHRQPIDLVLLCSGIPAATELKLRKIFMHQHPQLKIIQHFGGGSGLLSNEIEAALSGNENGNFNVIDNPFENKIL